MQYRRFGRTELAMPVFSCGGMRYQYKWQDQPWAAIPPDNQENIRAIIDRSLDLGINHIETARAYGTSEMQLGPILQQYNRDRLIIQTKVTPSGDRQEFRQKLEQSLAYLQLDYVDLLGIHGINNQEIFDHTFNGGCMEVVREFQRAGRIRFVGFSTHGNTEIITRAINTGEFDYVNLHWYWIFQEHWSAIAAATAQDMGVFIISPSNKGGMLYEPSERLVELCRPLSPMVFNNLFCLSHPQVHTLSIGADKPTDFDEHVKTLALLDHAADYLPAIIDRLEKAACDRLGADWVNTWHQGLPEWEDTPGQVNIKTILWLRNLAIAYDMTTYAKMRYNLLGSADHWFPGKRAQHLEELDFRACLTHSPHRETIPHLLAETETLLGGASQQRLSQSS